MLDTQISDATWIIPEDLWFIRAVGPYIRFMLESAWVLLLFQRRKENLFGLSNSKPNFTAIIEHCNLWRNYDDIQDSWSSLESIIDYYGNNQDAIVPNAGPGHWNDPDMVSFNTQNYLKTSMIFRQLIYLYAGWRAINCFPKQSTHNSTFNWSVYYKLTFFFTYCILIRRLLLKFLESGTSLVIFDENPYVSRKVRHELRWISLDFNFHIIDFYLLRDLKSVNKWNCLTGDSRDDIFGNIGIFVNSYRVNFSSIANSVFGEFWW